MFTSITLPTRSSGTLIDQIYCKLKDRKQLVLSCVIGTMNCDHYLCIAIMDIFQSQKHQPKFVLYYICKYIIMIQRSFAPFITNCQRDFKMCPSLLIYVLIRMMIMNCLNRLWWSPSQISSFKNVRFKMYKHRLSPDGILRSIKYRDQLFYPLFIFSLSFPVPVVLFLHCVLISISFQSSFVKVVYLSPFIVQDPDRILIWCVSRSACKSVPNTSLFVNDDILYLLSHVNSVSLSTGQIISK